LLFHPQDFEYDDDNFSDFKGSFDKGDDGRFGQYGGYDGTSSSTEHAVRSFSLSPSLFLPDRSPSSSSHKRGLPLLVFLLLLSPFSLFLLSFHSLFLSLSSAVSLCISRSLSCSLSLSPPRDFVFFPSELSSPLSRCSTGCFDAFALFLLGSPLFLLLTSLCRTMVDVVERLHLLAS
jgi:hypothetical protein